MRYLPNRDINETDIECACDELKDLMLRYLEDRTENNYDEAHMAHGYITGLIDAMYPEDEE